MSTQNKNIDCRVVNWSTRFKIFILTKRRKYLNAVKITLKHSLMEAKLTEYRARRRRKELIESTKEKLASTKEKLAKTTDKILSFITPKFLMDDGRKDEEVLLIDNEETYASVQAEDDASEIASEIDEQEKKKQESWTYFIAKYSIYSLIWITLYIVFLKLQFGAVFLVISMLIGIYCNTRTGPRKRGEMSAYSVFNENCVSIDGTLKAEQFEREIRFGPGSVR